MVALFANSGDPDQIPHSAASDLGLHCLPIILLGVSRLQWINVLSKTIADKILFFSYYFSEKIILGISCESSARQTIHRKCQALLSLNIFCCSCGLRINIMKLKVFILQIPPFLLCLC